MATAMLDAHSRARVAVNHVVRRLAPCLLLPVLLLVSAIPADAYEYVAVGAAELVPIDNAQAYLNNGICVRVPVGYVAEFQAPVQVPHGATIVTVTLEACDAGGGEFGGYVTADLFMARYFGYGIITQANTGVGPAPGDTRIPVSTYFTVDNAEYSYAVHVRINNVTGSAWETEMFYKMIIEYIPPTSDVAPGGEPLPLEQLKTFPNPSSQRVQVSYRTETDAEVSGRVYDVSGRLVADLCQGHQKAGAHLLEWDRRDNSGVAVAAGTYVLAVTVGTATIARKVVVVD